MLSNFQLVNVNWICHHMELIHQPYSTHCTVYAITWVRKFGFLAPFHNIDTFSSPIFWILLTFHFHYRIDCWRSLRGYLQASWNASMEWIQWQYVSYHPWKISVIYHLSTQPGAWGSQQYKSDFHRKKLRLSDPSIILILIFVCFYQQR